LFSFLVADVFADLTSLWHCYSVISQFCPGGPKIICMDRFSVSMETSIPIVIQSYLNSVQVNLNHKYGQVLSIYEVLYAYLLWGKHLKWREQCWAQMLSLVFPPFKYRRTFSGLLKSLSRCGFCSSVQRRSANFFALNCHWNFWLFCSWWQMLSNFMYRHF
jgi:hypothetical protein